MMLVVCACGEETPEAEPQLDDTEATNTEDATIGEPDAPPVTNDTEAPPDIVLPEGCGDGVCEGAESKASCCTDCGCGKGFACDANQCVTAPTCGDGQCQPDEGEDCNKCQSDCGCLFQEVCTLGGACCGADCDGKTCGPDGCGGSCGSCSGGSVCAGGQCASDSFCGDNVCAYELGEHCDNCPGDCQCEVAEQCMPDGECCASNCAGKHCGDDGCGATCGTCGPDALCMDNLCIAQFGCGNLKCEPGEDEDCSSCPQDCACDEGELCHEGACCTANCDGKECGSDGCAGNCGACPQGEGCVAGTCEEEVYCGNGVCDAVADENCKTCLADCPCTGSAVCAPGGACCEPSCAGKECGSDSCGGSCGSCNGGDVCGPGGQCSGVSDYPALTFEPAGIQAGGTVVVSVLDTTPWAYVGLSASGPCGVAPAKWKGVEQIQVGVWRWQYTLGPLTGGSYAVSFTHDNGGGVVVAAALKVSGNTQCDGGLVCASAGASCEDEYPEAQVCGPTGQSKTVTCFKKGTCTGIGGGEKCSWGAGSFCANPCDGGGEVQPPSANRFGIGLVGPGDKSQWDLAADLAGNGGHVLLIFPGVKKNTKGAEKAWKDAVSGLYERGLVPVIRLGPGWGENQIRNDSDDPQHLSYKTLAKAYKKVVEALPKKDGTNLYIQVHNEPNLCTEWACSGGGWLDAATRAAEYAAFFRDVADALHAIGDPRIKVSLGALAPGGAVGCQCCGDGQCEFTPGATGLDFMGQMQAAVPGIWSRLDYLASHSYPAQGTGWGFFVPYAEAEVGLTYFEQELDAVGDGSLPVMVTETGWPRSFEGFEDISDGEQAQWTKKAYQNVWLKHPNVIGVTPFILQDAYWGDQVGFGYIDTDGKKRPVFTDVKDLRCTLGFGPCL